ncbi:DUF4184 family protein [Microbacterium sp. KR10-403]|uniref:DUF4184 family protein n=1 Tax=Microbacterium sp. KR10-403 TaxID=3158581 RepID=UPI0032E44F2A
MPFTPSHAIVALPFARTPLAPAAVAVGAMTPDLPLFLRGTAVDYGWTHDPAWLPATVLLAAALLLLWRCVLRPAARELVPAFIARRLPGEWDAGAAASAWETCARRGAARASVVGILLLVAALAIGVASHLAWDAFSHEGRLGVQVLPALDAAWGPLPGYKWIQHGSSLVGLAVLAVWAAIWWRRTPPATLCRVTAEWMPWAWLLALPITLAMAWVIGLAVHGPLTPSFTVAHLAYRVLPPACAIWGVATVLLAVGVQLRRRR